MTWQQKYSEIDIRRITHSPFPSAPRKTVQLMDTFFSLLTFCVGERWKKKRFFSPWYIKARNQLLAELSKSCGIMGETKSPLSSRIVIRQEWQIVWVVFSQLSFMIRLTWTESEGFIKHNILFSSNMEIKYSGRLCIFVPNKWLSRFLCNTKQTLHIAFWLGYCVHVHGSPN